MRARALGPGPTTLETPIRYALVVIESGFESKRNAYCSAVNAVRTDVADRQWRTVPLRAVSIALVADERFGRVTGRIEAS
jgi:hypothetical protein